MAKRLAVSAAAGWGSETSGSKCLLGANCPPFVVAAGTGCGDACMTRMCAAKHRYRRSLRQLHAQHAAPETSGPGATVSGSRPRPFVAVRRGR